MRRLLISLLAAVLFLHTGNATLRGEVVTGAPVTRAQAVTSILLSRSPKLPPYDVRKQFADLPAGAWFESPMRAAEQYGIIQVDAERRLHPELPVTRAEFLRMLARTFHLPENLPFRYTDIVEDAWHARFAGMAERYQLFPDDTDAFRLLPNAHITQREASAALEAVLHSLRTGITDKAPEDTTRVVQEQQLAREQAEGKLQMYLIISTRRVRVQSLGPAVPLPPPPPPMEQQKNLHELRAGLLLRINQIRTQKGLRPLQYNTMLERSAQGFAEDMARRGYFSHVSPEGTTLRERIQTSGYRDRSFAEDCFCIKGYSLAENLARGQRTVQEVIAAWMKSPSHREAILGSEYKDTGFGMSAGYWVQHFGAVILPANVVIYGVP